MELNPEMVTGSFLYIMVTKSGYHYDDDKSQEEVGEEEEEETVGQGYYKF